MALHTVLIERLERLAQAGPEATGEGRQLLSVSADGYELALTLGDYDRYSVTLEHLRLSGAQGRSTPEQTIRTRLSEHSAAIVRQLQYLEEPLAVWEFEPTEGMAQ